MSYVTLSSILRKGVWAFHSFINKSLHNLKEFLFKQYIEQYLHNPSKNLGCPPASQDFL